jgi:hypothetical protein
MVLPNYTSIMKEFLDLLHSDNFYGVSDNIEILKGKNEMVTNFSDAKQKIKRIWLKRK